MTRCKHQNGVLIEVIRAQHERDVRDGTMDPRGINGPAHPAGFAYHCDDCGKRWSYSSTPRPKWLRAIHEQLAL